MNEFDVHPHPKGFELVPDFFKPELSETELEVYEEMIESLGFKQGGMLLEVTDEMFNPPERVTFRELHRRFKKHHNFVLGPPHWD